MESLESRFEFYLKTLLNLGLSSNDKLTRSRFFNGKVEDFYKDEIKLNHNTSKTELTIKLSAIRVKYQVQFVGI